MVTEDYIVSKVHKLAILPTFPKIVSEILALIEDPMSSASDLARQMDPSMTGEVLRIANTAYFGTSNFRRIHSVERAIAVIGYEHLSFVILQMPFLALISEKDRRFNKRSFLNHAVTCGILSRHLSELLFPIDHGEVYVSGILHDIGRIILYHLFRKEWQEMSASIEQEGLDPLDAERSTFLVDHGHVGAILLESWNLPNSIAHGVRFHHSAESVEEYRENALAISLGNALSKEIDISGSLGTFDEFLAAHREFMNGLAEYMEEITPSHEVTFFSRVYEGLRSARRFLGYTEDDDPCIGS